MGGEGIPGARCRLCQGMAGKGGGDVEVAVGVEVRRGRGRVVGTRVGAQAGASPSYAPSRGGFRAAKGRLDGVEGDIGEKFMNLFRAIAGGTKLKDACSEGWVKLATSHHLVDESGRLEVVILVPSSGRRDAS